jgi:hypothetical protein
MHETREFHARDMRICQRPPTDLAHVCWPAGDVATSPHLPFNESNRTTKDLEMWLGTAAMRAISRSVLPKWLVARLRRGR